MSDAPTPKHGLIGWVDLSVENATEVRDFYKKVVGWESTGFEMDGYDDYCVHPEGADPVAGICHARGDNADMPRNHWLVYITVEDLDRAMATCVEQGGKVIRDARGAGGGKFCLIEDPAGSVVALYQGG